MTVLSSFDKLELPDKLWLQPTALSHLRCAQAGVPSASFLLGRVKLVNKVISGPQRLDLLERFGRGRQVKTSTLTCTWRSLESAGKFLAIEHFAKECLRILL